MGTEPQETRSLPRNRKCGNCRHFEPAPLWRKGWCRNPLLYPTHANHLVDSTGLDCESGFRSRIYWEPLPTGIANNAIEDIPVVNFRERATRAIEPLQPMGANFKPTEYAPEETEDIEPAPAYTRLPHQRDEAGWRAEVRKRLPFTTNWPLEKIELYQVLMWGAALFLLLIALIVLLSSNKPALDAKGVAGTAAAGTQLAQNSFLGGTPNVTGGTTSTTNTPLPATATALGVLNKTGKVAGLGGETLNVRQEPGKSAAIKILAKLKEGDKVKILDGPVDKDAISWYKVEANGIIGWVSKEFVVLDK